MKQKIKEFIRKLRFNHHKRMLERECWLYEMAQADSDMKLMDEWAKKCEKRLNKLSQFPEWKG